jgi:hypothetical protein
MGGRAEGATTGVVEAIRVATLAVEALNRETATAPLFRGAPRIKIQWDIEASDARLRRLYRRRSEHKRDPTGAVVPVADDLNCERGAIARGDAEGRRELNRGLLADEPAARVKHGVRALRVAHDQADLLEIDGGGDVGGDEDLYASLRPIGRAGGEEGCREGGKNGERQRGTGFHR